MQRNITEDQEAKRLHGKAVSFFDNVQYLNLEKAARIKFETMTG